MMDIDVLVVIGVGGMGLAIARRLGAGRTVLLADFDETTLGDAATTLHGEGHEVKTQVVDVSDHNSVASLADIAAGLGRVTHVAHTAGVSPEQAPIEAVLKVDLLGVAHVLDEFARVIAPRGAGIVIASMAGHMGALPSEQERALAITPTAELLDLPFLSPEKLGHPGIAYTVAKRGNAVRVQAAAAAWGKRGARINSISPGVISTPMGRQELSGESGQRMQGWWTCRRPADSAHPTTSPVQRRSSSTRRPASSPAQTFSSTVVSSPQSVLFNGQGRTDWQGRTDRSAGQPSPPLQIHRQLADGLQHRRAVTTAHLGIGEMFLGVDEHHLDPVEVQPTDHLEQNPAAGREDRTDEGQVEHEPGGDDRFIDQIAHDRLHVRELEVALKHQQGDSSVPISEFPAAAQHGVRNHRRIHEMQIHVA